MAVSDRPSATGRSGECTGMDWQKIAPRQLLLRCSTAYIHVGVRFLHFRHPWRSYTARGQDDVQDVQVSREAMDGRKRPAVSDCAEAAMSRAGLYSTRLRGVMMEWWINKSFLKYLL
jgi:hypothetical protein